MVDLDSNPTKLIEVVHIGKQMLMTRGPLTTFSIANDVAKYFAIIPAAFAATYPQLDALNLMHLTSPQSAILSAVIFNALIIIALLPLALRGVHYRPMSADRLLGRNLLIYGLGGLLERVLVNVLENGCKYAGAKATFGIGARLHGEELEIQIWDDGPGLPPGKEQMIFEKFARGDSESAIPGVGLGLAICRAIIEAHGGRIRAENRPQGGARFSFTLPYKVPPQVWENSMEEA